MRVLRLGDDWENCLSGESERTAPRAERDITSTQPLVGCAMLTDPPRVRGLDPVRIRSGDLRRPPISTFESELSPLLISASVTPAHATCVSRRS
jgi:hypothetical protein